MPEYKLVSLFLQTRKQVIENKKTRIHRKQENESSKTRERVIEYIIKKRVIVVVGIPPVVVVFVKNVVKKKTSYRNELSNTLERNELLSEYQLLVLS